MSLVQGVRRQLGNSLDPRVVAKHRPAYPIDLASRSKSGGRDVYHDPDNPRAVAFLRGTKPLRLPPDRGKTLEPVIFADDSQMADMTLKAKLQDAAINYTCGLTRPAWFAQMTRDEKASPFKNILAALYATADKLRENLAH